ncbi:family 20 glycosylhydrolase [Dyella acidisoli]|uniref:family 20 glycosylhydrolase n=1 Tax=Dyella acidisoli TaxID=1867834 RepID=UPI0024E19089|nr:family 20 glycosylhydrolase [Dyella acidisoli]
MLAPNPAPVVIPTLQSWQGGQGRWELHEHSRILIDPSHAEMLRPLAAALARELANVSDIRPQVRQGKAGSEGDITLRLASCDNSSLIGDEGYVLEAGRSLSLCARTRAGLFYASRTLLQMLMLDGQSAGKHRSVPRGHVLDYPRYSERSVMFDVGRKFASVPFLEDYIRFMGWYKLNTLHLHLDDQVNSDDHRSWSMKAFRLKSDNPVFHDLLPSDGQYYTRQDWNRLEEIAAANAVRIVPEIDTPGHAGAIGAARPDLLYQGGTPSGGTLDPSKPQTLAYVESIFAEFLPWFRSDVIHIGGDEASVNQEDISIVSQVNYLNQLGHFLQWRGKQVEMWGSADFAIGLDKSFLIQRWINWGDEAKFNWGEHGFRWTESYGDWYIVPFGPDYFNPKGVRGDALYDGWDNRTPASVMGPHGPTGGQIAVWNDKGARDYDYENTVHGLFKDAIPAAGQVFWRGQAHDATGAPLSYSVLRQSIEILQYGPGTRLFSNSRL